MVKDRNSQSAGVDLVHSLRRKLAENIGPGSVERYFDGQTRMRLGAECLEVTVTSGMMAQMLNQRFGKDLRRAAGEVVGRPDGLEVSFRVDRDSFARGESASRAAPRTAAGDERSPRPAAKPVRSAPAQSRYTFANFLVGKSNRMAHAAATRLAEGEGPATPLFIHAPCGMGKTHLLQATVARFLELNPGANVRYTTAEAFTNEFVMAIKANRVDGFRKAYRRLDLLCLDDVHFFAGKDATQSELMHTLDAAGLDGGRVIVASDDHPRQIERLSERLISRWLAGVVVKIEPPDRELRERLVKHLSGRRGMVLEEGAARLIVDRTERAVGTLGGFGGSVREIEGLLNQIDAVHRMLPELSGEGSGVGVVLVRRALGLSGSEPEEGAGMKARRPIGADVIIAETSRAMQVEVSDLKGKGRHPRVVMARSMAAYLCRTLTTLSFPEIARAMGRGNHSTVVTAFQRIEKQMAKGDTIESTLAPDFAGLSLRDMAERLAKQVVKAASAC